MEKRQVIKELNKAAGMLEDMKLLKEAKAIHNVFIKVASEFKNDYNVEFPMNLDDALNNYDSGTYSVDQKGSWEDAEPISDFREELSDADLHQPAAVDDNHIVFYNEDEEHVEVMNMIPKHHLDSLHKNPSDETRRIKRAKE
jgi:DNA-dependent RNA polymerase auxiliary subunit epsilon